MNRPQTVFMVLATAAGLLVLLVIADPKAALSGWLAAFAFAGSVPLGCLCLAAMLRIIPGGWHTWVGPGADTGLSLLPLLLPAVLPVILGAGWLYGWAGDPQLGGFKGGYLSPVFFGFRSLFLLTAFALLGLGLGLLEGRKPRFRLAVVTLIAFALFDGVLAVDWLMSLDPGFHSSGFSLYVMALQVLTAFSFIVLFQRTDLPDDRAGLLGGLFLAVQLLWPYFAFMQYFIIWSDDLPETVRWYLMRGEGGWVSVERIFIGLHLASAFSLLFPPLLRNLRWLRLVAAASLVASGLEYAWLVLPSLDDGLAQAVLAFVMSLVFMAIGATVYSLRISRRRRNPGGKEVAE